MKNRKSRRVIQTAASVLLLVAALFLLLDHFGLLRRRPAAFRAFDPIPVSTPVEVISITEEPSSEVGAEASAPVSAQEQGGAEPDGDGLPHDKLFITVERQRYERGNLRLVIPRLSLDKSVGNGTSTDELSLGPALYEYAQLPGEGNRNVSIAAHRQKGDFYYLDELTGDDYLYLVDKENIYRYIYESTEVIDQDDWGPIYSQGYSLITLTTCTPIGIGDHRMIVRAALDEIFPYDDAFIFAPAK